MKLFFQVEWYLLSPNLHLQLHFVFFISLSFGFKIPLCGSSTCLIQEPLSLLSEARVLEVSQERLLPACPVHLLVHFAPFLKTCTFAVESTPFLNHEVISRGGSRVEVDHKCSQTGAVIRWRWSQAPCFAIKGRNINQTITEIIEASVVCKACHF